MHILQTAAIKSVAIQAESKQGGRLVPKVNKTTIAWRNVSMLVEEKTTVVVKI